MPYIIKCWIPVDAGSEEDPHVYDGVDLAVDDFE